MEPSSISFEAFYNIKIVQKEERPSQEFLASEKRLFNRRGSDDSESSTASASQPSPLSSSPLNPDAPEFIPPISTLQTEGKAKNKSADQPTSKRNRRCRSRRNSVKRCCQHCLRKNFDAAQYGSHSMRHPKTQDLICPVLLSNL